MSTRGASSRVSRRAFGEHPAGELDVTRFRIPPEAEPGRHEREIRAIPKPLRIGRAVREFVEPVLGTRRTRTEHRVCERRQQDDARDAFGGKFGIADHELLHRDATHRVADEHRVVKIEPFHHGLDVEREVLE